MNTQTHILIAATLFAKPGKQNRAINAAALLGGILPDLTIFVMFFWSKIIGTPEMEVWEKWYYNPFWQFWIDAFNSLPLYSASLITGLIMGLIVFKTNPKLKPLGIALAVFSTAALAHLIGDFFLHVEDAHAHFWPLSHWRFISPVSYWNPAYWGNYVAFVELVAGIVMSIVLFKRFKARWVRALLIITILSYILVPIYFLVTLGL